MFNIDLSVFSDIFRRVFKWLRLGLSKAGPFIDKYVEPAIDIVSAVKAVIENPKADLEKELKDRLSDDEIRADQVDKLIKVIMSFGWIVDGGKSLENDEVIQFFIKFFRSLKSKELRDGGYLQLASEIARINSGNKISRSESNTITQATYSFRKGNERVTARAAKAAKEAKKAKKA